MRLVRPSFEIWEQDLSGKPEGIVTSPETITKALVEGMDRHITRCGYVCYKTDKEITAESAEAFKKKMMLNGHLAMLEHASVYLRFSQSDMGNLCTEEFTAFEDVASSPYSKTDVFDRDILISTNYRVLVEKQAEILLPYCVPFDSSFHRRITVHFVCNRQVSHEFVRHKVFSFAQESTRYCNYTLGKFNKELKFIVPCWTKLVDGNDYDCEIAEICDVSEGVSPEDQTLLKGLCRIEETYFSLIDAGWQPQQAATVLPNALKTELVMTGFIEDWKHFFNLRALGKTGAPHPQAKELAYPLMEEFIRREWLPEDFASLKDS